MTHLCRTVGGNFSPLFTISENVDEVLSYHNHLKACSAENKDIRNEIKFLEDQMIHLDETKLRPVMKKYKTYIEFNIEKKALIFTSRVHPGET